MVTVVLRLPTTSVGLGILFAYKKVLRLPTTRRSSTGSTWPPRAHCASLLNKDTFSGDFTTTSILVLATEYAECALDGLVVWSPCR